MTLRKVLKRLQQPSLLAISKLLFANSQIKIQENVSRSHSFCHIATVEQLQLEYTHTHSQLYLIPRAARPIISCYKYNHRKHSSNKKCSYLVQHDLLNNPSTSSRLVPCMKQLSTSEINVVYLTVDSR